MPFFGKITIGLALGITGLTIMMGVLYAEQGPQFDLSRNNTQGLLYAAFFGALVAGLIFEPFFGQKGSRGWKKVAIGASLATVLGGAIGGTFIFPGIGTIVGALFPLQIMLQLPFLLLWLAMMAAVHLMARKFRTAVS